MRRAESPLTRGREQDAQGTGGRTCGGGHAAARALFVLRADWLQERFPEAKLRDERERAKTEKQQAADLIKQLQAEVERLRSSGSAS